MLQELRSTLDGELLTPGEAGYDGARSPRIARFRDVHPRALVQCATVRDVVRTVAFARDTGIHVVARGGGHCFAGRSSTSEGVVLDLGRLSTVRVEEQGRAVIGSGARLDRVYDVLHQHGRTLPLGCGLTVGVAGLTLGGGLGLLGRRYGLTCDSLVCAQVVLHDGRLVDCDADREPDLFWALRGAGGGQLGVVTSFTFITVPEPHASHFAATWPEADAAEVIAAWQAWAPDAPDDITANLDVSTRPGCPIRVVVTGLAVRGLDATLTLLDKLTALVGHRGELRVREGVPHSELKRSIVTPDPREHDPRARGRSELFASALPDTVVAALLEELTTDRARGLRQLSFFALGGAYSRVDPDATAFPHRTQRFLLDHLAAAADADAWIDRSWAIAHPHGNGRVYANFPDPRLDDPGRAYHGDNLARLVAVKDHYDPMRLFHFPQAV
jgi:FAD/FMN-containing dehydrogenase